MSQSVSQFSRITGTGSYLPPRLVTNAELVAELAAQGIESSDSWITERTGIQSRYFADSSTSASDLGVEAAKKALAAAALSAEEIDLIIVATSTPDMIFPSTACLIQQKLGATQCAAFDVQAVCSGFVYALTTADAFIRANMAKKVLVIGAEVFSRLLDFKDRTTCVLFGDGAGAVVLEASDQPGIVASKLSADGRCANILCVPAHVSGGQVIGQATILMDGPAVFKQAVSVLEEAALAVLKQSGYTTSDINWLIPHQANIRIMQNVAKKLTIEPDKLVVTVNQHGNVSAASIPLALDHAVSNKQIKRGDTLMLAGVGGGFTWGAVLLKY